MIFETNTTTLEEDLAIWLKWNRIEPSKETVADFKRTLETALKQGESILACLDSYVLSRVKKNQDFSNEKGRNFFRENVTRLMRQKNLSEAEAEQIMLERIATKETRNIRKSIPFFDFQARFESEEKPAEAVFCIVTRQEEVFFFQTRAEVHRFLVEKFSYKNITTAQCLAGKSITRFVSIGNWQLFLIHREKANFENLLEQAEKPIGAKTAIVTLKKVHFFNKRTAASNFLVEAFGYTNTECARTMIFKNIQEGKSVNGIWQAFDLR